MKSARMLTILVLALGLMVSQAKVSEAVDPMGSAFTYQGHLYDANHVADGVYDFQFKLYKYKQMMGYTQEGNDVNKPDVNVIDGYFTVELDFNSPLAFNGDARWLEIGVRPLDPNDSSSYSVLSPRQELTPTPYALHSKNADTLDWSDSSAFASSAHNHNSLYVNVTGDSMSGSSSGSLLSVSNTGSGDGVYGLATGSFGYGVHGEAEGIEGQGVVGRATNTGNEWNYGGHFTAAGSFGRGVYGKATNNGNCTNHGGYFLAAGSTGRGVQAAAYNSGNYTNYGGHFTADGNSGRGVYGEARGTNGCGVYGNATGPNSIGVWAGGGKYAGYFNGKTRVTGDLIVDGNVGIGTTNPGYELHVVGDIAYTGTISDISDVRLKENITPLANAIEKISALRGIYFNNKGESSNRREVGVIAQDVEAVLPELVSTAADGYKSVDYTKLTAVLIEAVKELKVENQSLKQRVEALESTIQRPGKGKEVKL